MIRKLGILAIVGLAGVLMLTSAGCQSPQMNLAPAAPAAGVQIIELDSSAFPQMSLTVRARGADGHAPADERSLVVQESSGNKNVELDGLECTAYLQWSSQPMAQVAVLLDAQRTLPVEQMSALVSALPGAFKRNPPVTCSLALCGSTPASEPLKFHPRGSWRRVFAELRPAQPLRTPVFDALAAARGELADAAKGNAVRPAAIVLLTGGPPRGVQADVEAALNVLNDLQQAYIPVIVVEFAPQSAYATTSTQGGSSGTAMPAAPTPPAWKAVAQNTGGYWVDARDGIQPGHVADRVCAALNQYWHIEYTSTRVNPNHRQAEVKVSLNTGKRQAHDAATYEVATQKLVDELVKDLRPKLERKAEQLPMDIGRAGFLYRNINLRLKQAELELQNNGDPTVALSQLGANDAGLAKGLEDSVDELISIWLEEHSGAEYRGKRLRAAELKREYEGKQAVYADLTVCSRKMSDIDRLRGELREQIDGAAPGKRPAGRPIHEVWAGAWKQRACVLCARAERLQRLLTPYRLGRHPDQIAGSFEVLGTLWAGWVKKPELRAKYFNRVVQTLQVQYDETPASVSVPDELAIWHADLGNVAEPSVDAWNYYLLLGRIDRFAQKTADAADHFIDALKHPPAERPLSVEQVRELLGVLLDGKRPQEALDLLSGDLVSADERWQFADNYVTIGNIFADDRSWEKAREAYETAAQLKPDSPTFVIAKVGIAETWNDVQGQQEQPYCEAARVLTNHPELLADPDHRARLKRVASLLVKLAGDVAGQRRHDRADLAREYATALLKCDLDDTARCSILRLRADAYDLADEKLKATEDHRQADALERSAAAKQSAPADVKVPADVKRSADSLDGEVEH